MNSKGRVGEIDLRVGIFKMKSGWDLAVFQRKDRLDKTGDACGGIEVANVTFDRAEGAELTLIGLLSEGLRERRDFDGIAHGGSGAMGFEIAHLIR